MATTETRAALAGLLEQLEGVSREDVSGDWLVLADLLHDSGRTLEEQLVRLGLDVRATPQGVRPELTVSDAGSNDGGVPVQWVNCFWGGVARLRRSGLGGCWVHSEKSAWEENQRRNYHSSHPSRIDAGDVEAYSGSDMTGGSFPGEDYYASEFGLDIDEEGAEELTEWVREESERVCRPEAERILGQAAADLVEAARRECSGGWTGCDWGTGDDYPEDLDGMTAQEAAERLDGCDDDERHGWERAHEYLVQCEAGAEAAEAAGEACVAAARQGDWEEAERQADLACSLEGQFGDCPTWRRLRETVRQVRR